MNATLGEMIAVDRTGLRAVVGEVPTVGWATSAVRQIIRAAGVWGSLSVKLKSETFFAYTANQWTKYWIDERFWTPPGYFGSIIPPAIFVHIQYGSVVIYRNWNDPQPGEYIKYNTANSYSERISRDAPYITYIKDLEWRSADDCWEFNVYHETHETEWALSSGDNPAAINFAIWNSGFAGMANGYWPFDKHREAHAEEGSRTTVIVHWIALGADANQTKGAFS